MVDARQVSAYFASGPSRCFEERTQRGCCKSSCCPCEKSLICVETGWSSWEPTSHESSQWSPESANCQSRITWPHGGMTRRKKQSWEDEDAGSERRLDMMQDWREADGEVWSKRPGSITYGGLSFGQRKSRTKYRARSILSSPFPRFLQRSSINVIEQTWSRGRVTSFTAVRREIEVRT